MRDAGQDEIRTLTLSFREFHGRADDEAPLAEQVAQHYGTRHTTRIVTEQEFRADLPRILDAMDQPTIDGINTWFVAKATRELGLKAAISGLGGDELFGGYASFRQLPRWVRWLSLPSRLPLLGDVFRRAISALAPAFPRLNPKTAGLLKHGGDWAGAYLLRRGLFMPWELPALLDPAVAWEGLARLDPLRHIERAMSPGPRTAFAKVAALESSLYMRNQLLRDTDWASMAHSLEVRVPLVDARLLSRIAPLTTGRMVADGKSALAGSPAKPLPARIAKRVKTGFSMPLGAWLQRSMASHSREEIAGLGSRRPWTRRWAHQLVSA
jgi:asparagine synthase (glutamine-hydrolysing)